MGLAVGAGAGYCMGEIVSSVKFSYRAGQIPQVSPILLPPNILGADLGKRAGHLSIYK